MSADGTEVGKLRRQQAAVARFGRFALREDDLLKVLTEAARICLPQRLRQLPSGTTIPRASFGRRVPHSDFRR
jgi:hypothetical protein